VEISEKDNENTVAMKAELEINGEIIEVIVDSGASTSMITDNLRRRLNIPITSASKTRGIMANGEKAASLGKVTLEIRIDDEIIIPIIAEVFESKSETVLIGNNFLNKVSAIINYPDKILEIISKDEIIEIPIDCELKEEWDVGRYVLSHSVPRLRYA
jgi:predicted aspartyl protease